MCSRSGRRLEPVAPPLMPEVDVTGNSVVLTTAAPIIANA
jgi:hypothetical protein